MTSSIPREVNGKWYPVPCPDAMPIGMSFPSQEACLAACETSDTCEASWDELTYKLEAEFEERAAALEDEAEQIGRGAGYESGHDDGLSEAEAKCEAGQCEGYDVGWADGYAQGKGEKLPA